MRELAIYGKGGIGKSFIASHISYCLAERGFNVLQVGCDPKQDSCALLLKRKRILSVLDWLKQRNFNKEDVDIEEFVFTVDKKTSIKGSIYCIESGGPEPGVGCAGKGVAEAIEFIKQVKIQQKKKIDFTIYDVLGDVVCGGFSLPIREGFAQEIYIVTSSEAASLYAAANISRAIIKFSQRSGAKLAGIIGNSRSGKIKTEKVEGFVKALGSQLLGIVPFSELNEDIAIDTACDTYNSIKEITEKLLDSPEMVIPQEINWEQF
ncbi:MAG: hypothetical protein P9L96_02180 [Candidatus Gygaella obscura]|nr:hypothetical protein [Candidatus Gygaella obscura]